MQIRSHNMVYVPILQGKETPLWGASRGGRLEVSEFLLDRGADINQTTDVRNYRVYAAELLYPMCMCRKSYYYCCCDYPYKVS